MCKAVPDDKTPARGKVPDRAEYVVSDFVSVKDEPAKQVRASTPTHAAALHYSVLPPMYEILNILFLYLLPIPWAPQNERRLARIIPHGPTACIDSGKSSFFTFSFTFCVPLLLLIPPSLRIWHTLTGLDTYASRFPFPPPHHI